MSSWNRQTWMLRSLSYALGFVAVVSSILVASGLGDPADQWRQIAAVVAAVSAGLLTSLRTVHRSNGLRRAWRHVQPEAIRFMERAETDDSAALDSLLAAYGRAEEMIGDAEISVG